MDRRKFLKVAGIAAAGVLPVVLGLDFLYEAKGKSPPHLDPYARIELLHSWPTRVDEASPLLLLVNERSGNPFGVYLSEILRTEGLNFFQIGRVSDLSGAPLNWYDLIILAEGPLADDQVGRLEDYVANGGRLVAMRPDARLARLLGLEPLSGTLAEGYLQVETSHPVSLGIAPETLQFHGSADRYRLAGAHVVARLAEDADTVTAFPALTVHPTGQGMAAAWTFDLARSVAYLRQGNPARANQEWDGEDGMRAVDMFKGWIDLDRTAIPQADEKQRLLVNLLTFLSQGKRPLPRLWYFPGAAETMLVATGDSHGNPASAIEDILTRVEKRGGHFSTYYTAFPSSDWRRSAKKAAYWVDDLAGGFLQDHLAAPSPSQVKNWRARGHEFNLHPYVEQSLELEWQNYWEEFTGLGYGPVSPTVRTHRVLWTGWVETARVQATHGMGLNLDYYHWGPLFRNESEQWVHGHFTGSGLPMKFVDEQGRILDIFQQVTHLADDHLLDLPFGGVAKLSAEEALEVAQTLMLRSLAGEYSAITCQFHVDPYAIGGKWLPEAIRWIEGTLDFAVDQGIPIWSAADWLRFVEARHDATMRDIQWQSSEKRLTFQLEAPPASGNLLTAMVPIRHDKGNLAEIKVDGVSMRPEQRKVGGVTYGWVSLPAAARQVIATYL